MSSPTPSKTIQITVLPGGQTTVQTFGFAGPSCKEASRFLEEALGQRVKEQVTSEYFQQQTEIRPSIHEKPIT